MEIHCPYCSHSIVVQGIRPGQFTPRCPQCQQQFALTIPDGRNAFPFVKPLDPIVKGESKPPARQPAATAPPASHATTPPPATHATTPPPAAASPPRAEPSRAGASAVGMTTPPPAAGAAAEPSRPLPVDTRPPVEDDASPLTLGGYQVGQKLGQGGMGAVYLARQVSLDRNVAVKVLSPQLADDAGFVARFTREAYAAAQLVHHNVVQVYDIGEDKGRHFYSMEFVPGDNLAAVIARDGKIDPATAVAYTLQAARGLKYAHDRGLIHRDVKPDNLMLNQEGVVKVADLGLVKQHGVSDVKTGVPGAKLARAQSADVTGFNLSMGTPAYMAPEQARDAARVDHRADIYSLGCTLYDLLTGRPPFSGKTALEVMTKHANEPIVPPDVLSKRVPKEVSALLMKMVAKRPEDRYGDIGQCIRSMEDFLGTGSAGPFTPKEEHAAALESANRIFRDAPLAQAARYAVPAFFGLVLLLAVGAALFGETLASRIVWAGTFVGVAVLTVAAYVVMAGLARGHAVLGKLRPLVFGASVGDWVRVLLILAVGVMVLNVFGLLTAWAVVALVAVGLAAVHVFGLLLARDTQRQQQVDAVQEMLRAMRLRGLDEDTLRQFVCRYSGQHWEELYEALFGYDAKLDARRRWGISLRGKSRPKFGVWRDALIAMTERRVAARKASRERRLLARTEEARLEAEGLDLLTARKRARQQAAAMVRQATAAKKLKPAVIESAARAAVTAAPMPAAALTPLRPMLYDEPIERDHESDFARKGGVPALVFGTTTRFPLGLSLLAIFFLWFHQNYPQFPDNFSQSVRASINEAIEDMQRTRELPPKAGGPALSKKAAPVRPSRTNDLRLSVLPEIARHTLSGYAVGLAGALLLASCFVRSVKTGVFALAGTAVLIVADEFVPGIGGVTGAMITTLAGVLLFVIGIAAGRE